MIREAETERYFVKQVKKFGGRAYKWVSPGNVGVPDRIAIFPGKPILFAELKTRKGKLSTAQSLHRQWLTNAGCLFAVIRSKTDVDIILTELCVWRSHV